MDAPAAERPDLDSTERLRARVAARAGANGLTPSANGARPAGSRRSVLPWLLLAMLATFLLGMIANPWFEAEVRGRLPAFARGSDVAADAAARARLDALTARVAALEARRAPAAPSRLAGAPLAAPDPGAGERLARLEGRVATLDAVATANAARLEALAGGVATATAKVEAASDETAAVIAAARASAAQARGVSLLAATRRELEAGRSLGSLAPALAAQFADAGVAPALGAVNALGAAPTTPARLAAGLDRIASALAETAPRARRDWFSTLADTVGAAVRPAEPDAPAAADRLGAARAALARGDVAAALAAVEALPPATRRTTATWRAAAARWLAGQRGLSALEAAAAQERL